MPDVLFLGDHLANHAGEQSNQRGHGTRQPFVISKRGQTDQRAAEQADDAPADQSHQERAFEREIEKAVTEPGAA